MIAGLTLLAGLAVVGGGAAAGATMAARPVAARLPVPGLDSVAGPPQVAVSPSPAVEPRASSAAPAPPAARFAIADAGNSILFDAEPAIRASLGDAGFFPHTIGGFGLSAYPEVWHGVLGHDVPSNHPAVVVMMMGNRDFEMARTDPNGYGTLLENAVRLMTTSGAKVLWLGLPPLPPNVDDEIDRKRVNAIYAELPRRFPGVVRYVSTDNVLGFAGVWVRTMPDDPSQQPVRKVKPDGSPDMHVCPAGAVRVARLVRAEALSMVSGMPPEPDGWDAGSWRDDLRYDDPPGACRPVRSIGAMTGHVLASVTRAAVSLDRSTGGG